MCLCERGAWSWGGCGCACYSADRYTICGVGLRAAENWQGKLTSKTKGGEEKKEKDDKAKKEEEEKAKKVNTVNKSSCLLS